MKRGIASQQTHLQYIFSSAYSHSFPSTTTPPHRHNQAITSAVADITFGFLTAAQLRQWVQDHPGHVDDLDCEGDTALASATLFEDEAITLPLVQWLIDAQGANVNCRVVYGATALYAAFRPAVVRALSERNGDPSLLDQNGSTALMYHAYFGRHECVTCLLEDPRVRETINVSVTLDNAWRGATALHIVCCSSEVQAADQPTLLRLLLTAGANPSQRDGRERTPLQILKIQQNHSTKTPRRCWKKGWMQNDGRSPSSRSAGWWWRSGAWSCDSGTALLPL